MVVIKLMVKLCRGEFGCGDVYGGGVMWCGGVWYGVL